MRAVLDPNVIISALLARDGSPARVLRSWLFGSYELVVSPMLLAELTRALAYPKIRARLEQGEPDGLVRLLREQAELVDDPSSSASAIHSLDPDDDYLVALAEATRSVIVSGDHHLLDLSDRIPVLTPARFLALLAPGT